MNFVAHFYLDRHYGNSSFAIGAATPDLLSIYNAELRIKNAQVQKVDTDSLSPVGQELLKGVERHFLADRIFHSSEFFTAETQFLSRSFADNFMDGDVPRKYFIAHVLLELMLDKVLIDNNPGLLEEYYHQFDEPDDFGEIHAATELISGRDLPNYDHFLQKFSENRYLYHYRRWDHIVYVLSRIMRRVNIEAREFLVDERFQHIMEQYEERLGSLYPAFFTEIHDKSEEFSRK